MGKRYKISARVGRMTEGRSAIVRYVYSQAGDWVMHKDMLAGKIKF